MKFLCLNILLGISTQKYEQKIIPIYSAIKILKTEYEIYIYNVFVWETGNIICTKILTTKIFFKKYIFALHFTEK